MELKKLTIAEEQEMEDFFQQIEYKDDNDYTESLQEEEIEL